MKKQKQSVINNPNMMRGIKIVIYSLQLNLRETTKTTTNQNHPESRFDAYSGIR